MARILHGQLHGPKKAICFTLVLDLNTLTFLGLGDNALFHSRLWHLVSESYAKIHDSSPVTTLFSKLGSVSSCSKMSWPTCTRRFFCPSFSNLGTFFAQIFRNDPLHPLTIHTQLICYHFSSKTAIASHLLSHMFNIFICSALASHPCDHLPPLLFPLWTSCATQKDEFLTSCYHHRLPEVTLVLQLEFFQDRQEISGRFVVSTLIIHTKKKKKTKFLILSNFHKTVTTKVPWHKNMQKRM